MPRTKRIESTMTGIGESPISIGVNPPDSAN
jgi:hypothetical protein